MELNQKTLKKAYNYLSKDNCLCFLIEKFSNDININELKSIGISLNKAHYILNVYKYFEDSNFDFKNASNKNVIEELSRIKGIGPWSSQMFLMFVLLRINVFSKGDLALMNSIKKNYRIDINDSISLDNLIDSWSPYKTVASLLLWKSIEEKYFYV